MPSKSQCKNVNGKVNRVHSLVVLTDAYLLAGYADGKVAVLRRDRSAGSPCLEEHLPLFRCEVCLV